MKVSDTRERILDCAERLFARQGFDGTSTRQIASDVGISIQTLHYHCESKLKLYNAVLERCILPITNIINKHMEELLKENDGLKHRIGLIIDDVFDEFFRNPNCPNLLLRQWLEQDQKLRKVEWDRLVSAIRLWAKKVEDSGSQNQETGVDVQLLFLSLLWACWGLFMNPRFIGELLGIDPESPEFVEHLKRHAKGMTEQILK